jgi:hypothetical protein
MFTLSTPCPVSFPPHGSPFQVVVTRTRVSPAAQLTASTRLMVRLGAPGALAGTVEATRVQVGPWGWVGEGGEGARPKEGTEVGTVSGCWFRLQCAACLPALLSHTALQDLLGMHGQL